MKKITFIVCIYLLLFGLMACGAQDNLEITATEPTQQEEESSIAVPESKPEVNEPIFTEQVTEKPTPQPEENGGNNVLVAYFSWTDNAVVDDTVDATTSASVIAPGNVAELAGWVQEETGGDLFSIRVTELYSSDWDECLERANIEKAENARPELVEQVENIDDYDTVFLGYPNWWSSSPMAIFSFLENNNLSGKQVYLFCSHGTGGIGSSVRDISAALPDTQISEDVFDVNEDDAHTSREAVQEWVAGLGLIASE